MPERKSVVSGSYRHGFNGKEVEPETSAQDYGMRIYNPRIGRFLGVDPIAKTYPELTPYQFASNRPLDGIDQDGLEWYPGSTPVEVAWNLFIQPFRDFSQGAVQAATGVAQESVVKSGEPSYQRDEVSQRVQNTLAKKDMAEAKSNQVSGMAKMVVASAEISMNLVPAGTEAALSVKAVSASRKATRGSLLLAANESRFVRPNSGGFLSWGSEFIDDGARMINQPLTAGGTTASSSAQAVRVGSGSILRKVDISRGIRHNIEKHFTGTGGSSLRTLDPNGNLQKWGDFVTNLVQTAPGASRQVQGGEIMQVMGQMERTGGGGKIAVGARLFRATGSEKWKVTTVLTHP